MSSNFNVAIAGSVPLIHDFDDVYPALASIKTSRLHSVIGMTLNLNAHVRVHPGNKRKRAPVHRDNRADCTEIIVRRRGR